MNGEVGTEAVRPRPLSGGLWTLFSWLRREDRLSTESISSVGSDRTVASFAFLGPGNYRSAAPIHLPPQGPPTDSYKKRVRDRNLRWQHERDITIHRKYGLYGYDAFSLPNARRGVVGTSTDRCERDRRAASESFPRRVHVPGKRRAPLPPLPSAPTSLNRRRARKRQAPQPPATITRTTKHDTDPKDLKMNSETNRKTTHHINMSPESSNKYEKKYKKDTQRNDTKVKHEKSFLKQIFENKKRNSAIETSTMKLLPNISELDKQAAELIERYKLKELNQKSNQDGSNDNSPGTSSQLTESWICTKCLKKYNGSVVTCSICLPLQRSSYSNSNRSNRISDSFTQTNSGRVSNEPLEDKEQLKKMLKEMKDGLNKKHNKDIEQTPKPDKEIKNDYPRIVETPTLRIGSTVATEHKENNSSQPSSTESKTSSNLNKPKELATIESVVVTQPVVLEHTKENIVVLDKTTDITRINNDKASLTNVNIDERDVKPSKPTKESDKHKLDNNNKPLKISSLLNPIYVPKTSVVNEVQQKQNAGTSSISNDSRSKIDISVSNNEASKVQANDITKIKAGDTETVIVQSCDPPKEEKHTKPVSPIVKTKLLEKHVPTASTSSQVTSNIVCKLDEHSRRRELVNQLERSIAQGDEKAAADAAIKLAQLRLTCSVLSFSSQIMSEPTPSASSQVSSTVNELAKIKVSSQSQPKPNTTIVGYALNQNNVPKGFNISPSNEASKTSTKVMDIVKEKFNKKETSPIKEKIPRALVQPGTSASVCNAISSTRLEPDDKKRQPMKSVASTSTGKPNTDEDDAEVPILVWVEDKESTRGPVQLHIRRKATVGELRKQADKSLGIAVRMQRWIVGQTLCSDDNTVLITVAGPELKAPFYLCLVEPESKANTKVEDKEVNAIGDVYKELVNLEKQALVANAEAFECGVCIEKCPSGEGVVLRDCIHLFCKECLSDVVKHSEEPIVTCPAMGCRGILQEREIRALVTPEDYQKWLARGLAVAESGTRNAFHCRTKDCTGWALCEPGVRRFPCPVCKHINCVPCQAIHEGETCEQYRARIEKAAQTTDASQTDDSTRELLSSLIAHGEALECPECKAIITKKWGCDWVKCSACKTEICWVTRGRRWGPGGRGDTSGGCRCGVDAKKCHPSCSYCH